ncbi:phospholipase C accessory protein PlcR [Burkholderia stagnalis]|uniref:Phospholipase C accessory protein PlcR n=1 Tax=Burkholderia stagnalis TaxID=1503054 RepID=A0A6L3MQ16_9BURK|nr:phospholipase C accessory protein PlcR [Burkholderia stagnalis]KAB0634348.1 phospholipase C accessory protein PlcR [Burkholderia stagnalis]VWB93554.1 phospholipase [Burkholderia stagnalis]
MSRDRVLWGGVVLAAGTVASAAVLWTSRLDAARPADSPPALQQETRMTNASTASPADFHTQFDGYAHDRATLGAAERQARARELLARLRAGADAGALDPHEASGIADLLWQDAEPDAAARRAGSDALREHLRDLAMGARAPSPARERQDAAYVAESRKIIDEVTRTVPDREQQRAALDMRLAELRRQIYGTAAPATHGG